MFKTIVHITKLVYRKTLKAKITVVVNFNELKFSEKMSLENYKIVLLIV